MPSVDERLARLETRVDQLAKTDNDMLTELRSMRKDFNSLRDEFTGKKGMVIGVMLTVSVIWAAALAVYQLFKPA